MSGPYEKAFEVTNELVKSALSAIEKPVNQVEGQNAAEYYQEVFDKVLEIAKLVQKEEG